MREHFLSFEVDRILSTPICRANVHDELCWVYGGDGVFRVKDVYSHALKMDHLASCSSGPDPLWQKI